MMPPMIDRDFILGVFLTMCSLLGPPAFLLALWALWLAW
jgi:hypothetical protein